MLTDSGEFVKGANVECASYGMSSISLLSSGYPSGEGAVAAEK